MYTHVVQDQPRGKSGGPGGVGGAAGPAGRPKASKSQTHSSYAHLRNVLLGHL